MDSLNKTINMKLDVKRIKNMPYRETDKSLRPLLLQTSLITDMVNKNKTLACISKPIHYLRHSESQI